MITQQKIVDEIYNSVFVELDKNSIANAVRTAIDNTRTEIERNYCRRYSSDIGYDGILAEIIKSHDLNETRIDTDDTILLKNLRQQIIQLYCDDKRGLYSSVDLEIKQENKKPIFSLADKKNDLIVAQIRIICVIVKEVIENYSKENVCSDDYDKLIYSLSKKYSADDILALDKETVLPIYELIWSQELKTICQLPNVVDLPTDYIVYYQKVYDLLKDVVWLTKTFSETYEKAFLSFFEKDKSLEIDREDFFAVDGEFAAMYERNEILRNTLKYYEKLLSAYDKLYSEKLLEEMENRYKEAITFFELKSEVVERTIENNVSYLTINIIPADVEWAVEKDIVILRNMLHCLIRDFNGTNFSKQTFKIKIKQADYRNFLSFIKEFKSVLATRNLHCIKGILIENKIDELTTNIVCNFLVGLKTHTPLK